VNVSPYRAYATVSSDGALNLAQPRQLQHRWGVRPI